MQVHVIVIIVVYIESVVAGTKRTSIGTSYDKWDRSREEISVGGGGGPRNLHVYAV